MTTCLYVIYSSQFINASYVLHEQQVQYKFYMCIWLARIYFILKLHYVARFFALLAKFNVKVKYFFLEFQH